MNPFRSAIKDMGYRASSFLHRDGLRVLGRDVIILSENIIEIIYCAFYTSDK
jgi:hypothetical protein